MCGRFHVSGWESRAEPQVSSSSSWTGAPSSISHLDPFCGSPRQVHTFTVDSVTLLVLPAHLRLLLESLDAAAPSSLPIELSKLNVSLSSPPLANSSSTVTLLSFGFSQPLNLLTSFLPSPLSSLCFQCVGPAEAPVGDTQRRNRDQVLAADPSAHWTRISVSCALRETQQERNLENWNNLLLQMRKLRPRERWRFRLNSHTLMQHSCHTNLDHKFFYPKEPGTHS